MTDKRRNEPLLKVHKLVYSDFCHDYNAPEIDENERPETKHAAEPDRIHSRVSISNLSA